MLFFYYIFSFLWGIIWGSFGGALIYRAKEGISILSPSSFCPKCRTPIRWFHKVPVLSYILLGGRCAYCGEKISPMYFILEVLSGLLGVFSMIFSSSPTEFLINFFFFWGLLTGAVSDIFYMTVPIYAILFSFFSSIFSVFILHSDFLSSFGGLVFGAGTLLLIKVIYRVLRKKEGLGEGDILFMIPVGLFLGFWGTIFVFIISSFLGGLLSFVLSLLGLKKKDEPIPFIPFIFIGVITTFLILRFLRF